MPFARRLSSPRFLGYATLAIGGALATLLAAFVLREARDSGRTVRVHFPEIATLSEGDAVREGGVIVGAVRRIVLADRRAVAELELFRHGALPEDTRFVNAAHSLMGARAVWLVRGASDRPLDESRVQEGVFAPGLPETLHAVHRLTVRVGRLRREAEGALGPGGPVGGLAAVLPALERTHAALADLPGPLARGAAKLGRGLEDAAHAATRVEAGVRASEPLIDSTRARVTVLLDRLDETAARLERALEATDAGLRRAADGNSLLTDRAAYDALTAAVAALDDALRWLGREGLGDSLAIRPRLTNPPRDADRRED